MRGDVIAWLRRYGTTLFLVLLIVFFTSQNQRFISLRNLTNILTEGSIYGIIAVGMTFVILTAGVDLAVGSLLAFAGMAGATVAGLFGADFAMSWIVALNSAIFVGAISLFISGLAARAPVSISTSSLSRFMRLTSWLVKNQKVSAC